MRILFLCFKTACFAAVFVCFTNRIKCDILNCILHSADIAMPTERKDYFGRIHMVSARSIYGNYSGSIFNLLSYLADYRQKASAHHHRKRALRSCRRRISGVLPRNAVRTWVKRLLHNADRLFQRQPHNIYRYIYGADIFDCANRSGATDTVSAKTDELPQKQAV